VPPLLPLLLPLLL